MTTREDGSSTRFRILPLILYGTSRSRASRSLWAIEETGVAYEHRPLQLEELQNDVALLAANPNARIPTLDDAGFVVWESFAINHYLAERYGGGLWPQSPELRARSLMWSFWSQTEIEYPLIAFNDAKTRGDAATAERRLEAVHNSLAVLNDWLAGSRYLLGENFTVADINLAAVLREPYESGVANFPEVDTGRLTQFNRWMDMCTSRPAYLRVRDLP